MNSKAMSLKARIRNYARENHITAQVVLQNYMFERFLARLSISDFRDCFVIKGGILIATIVGLDTRSTMDLDTTIRGLPLIEEKILEAVDAVSRIALDDEVTFETVSIEPIRKDDQYGGFRVKINAIYDTIMTPLSIDVSTGDVITPAAVLYEMRGIFDEKLSIELWGYNIETILAEKMETILSRSIFNTRPRDYYDVYILATTQKYNKQLFEKALAATAEHRNSTESISDRTGILGRITDSVELQTMCDKYRRRFSYASHISYKAIINVMEEMLER